MPSSSPIRLIPAPLFLLEPPCDHGPARRREYTADLGARLATALGLELHMKREWHCLTREEKRNGGMLPYASVLDLAVGPFATERSYADEYDRLLAEHSGIMETLLAVYRDNVQETRSDFPAPDLKDLQNTNANPRCFIAVEIERANFNPKHLYASAAYAAIWGKVGIVVAWNEARFQKLMQIRENMAMVSAYDKNSLCPANVLILRREQMDAVLTELRSPAR